MINDQRYLGTYVPVEWSYSCLMIKISTKGMYFSQAESTPANSGLVRTIPLKKPEKGKVSSDSSVPASLFC